MSTCMFCGATDFPPSLGGPNVCARCDTGDFGPEAMKRQAQIITTLQTEVKALRDGLEKIEKIISTNLYHQQEKIEDALSIARDLLTQYWTQDKGEEEQ